MVLLEYNIFLEWGIAISFITKGQFFTTEYFILIYVFAIILNSCRSKIAHNKKTMIYYSSSVSVDIWMCGIMDLISNYTEFIHQILLGVQPKVFVSTMDFGVRLF
jgi:hypothetical protein